MILSDKTLLAMLEDGRLKVSPLEREQIQPASIDVRLGDTFAIVEDSSSGIITLESDIKYMTIKTDTYLLLPCAMPRHSPDRLSPRPNRLPPTARRT